MGLVFSKSNCIFIYGMTSSLTRIAIYYISKFMFARGGRRQPVEGGRYIARRRNASYCVTQGGKFDKHLRFGVS